MFTLRLAAALIMLGSMSLHAAMAQDLILHQVEDGQSNWGPSQRSVTYSAVNSEVADDVDIVGAITKIKVSGYQGSIANPAVSPPPFRGIWIRFYAYGADGKPGALQKEYFLAAGDANLVYDSSSVGNMEATLSPAFQAAGKHYVSAQVSMDPDWYAYWYVWSSNSGTPTGNAVWFRNNLSPTPAWTHDFSYGVANSDMALQVYGVRTWPAPTVTSLSSTSAARSGRIKIAGQYFQPRRGTGQVFIGGVPAHISRWSDGSITAYVAENTPLGINQVQVVTSGGESISTPLNVTLRPAPAGRVKWRFQADFFHILHRPSVGPDGTVYVTDEGNLYAIAPDGGLKWLFWIGSALPTSVGLDGTVYAADMNVIYAINPNGTLKWRFVDEPGTFMIAGPTVGPDGNIYAVSEHSLGALSLTPQGQLRWNHGYYVDYGPLGQEIVFGSPGQFYFSVNMVGTGIQGGIFGYTLGGNFVFHQPDGVGEAAPGVGPDGTVQFGSSNGLNALTPAGQFKWTFPGFYVSSISKPEIGSDGVSYSLWNGNRLWAVNPDGRERWLNIWPELLERLTLSPLSDLLLAGARVTYGEPGYIQSFSTGGQPLWKVDLPFENGNWVTTSARPRFSPDGQAAYVGTVINDYAADPYCYVYAVDTSPTVSSGPALSSLTLNPEVVTSNPLGATSTGTVSLTGFSPSGGITVAIVSDNIAANVPLSVTVPAGQASVSFTVSAGMVTTVTRATITAKYGGISRSALLTINPESSTNPDTVAIQRAEYRTKNRQLRVEATSNGSGAVLRVYMSSTNALIGTLSSRGGGNFEGTFKWPSNPQNITVRSSLGGSASSAVTVR